MHEGYASKACRRLNGLVVLAFSFLQGRRDDAERRAMV